MSGPRLWVWLGLLSLVAGGCVSTPAPSSPESPALSSKASVAEPTCPCAEQAREVEQLRLEVASREAELRELRFNQRDQVKVLLDSKREITRAKVKLRRLATRADAASYIAEVEVALERLRASRGAKSDDPQIVAAQRLLEATDAPFTQGDYGAAMDRAAEAEQLIIAAAEDKQLRAPAPTRAKSGSRSRVASSPKATATRKAPPRPNGNVGGVGVKKNQRPAPVATSRIAPDFDRPV